MNKSKLNRFWLGMLVLILASVACMGGQPPQPVNTPTNNGNGNNTQTTSRENLIAATVQIYGLFNKNGELVTGYTGSGTVISADGLILTNAHVADPASQGEADFHPDVLAVGLVSSEEKPAVPAYRAEVLAIDGYLDLAVIRITATMDGGSINSSSLNLPYIPLGDSDQVHVGDHVNIYGFPGIGGNTITYTAGNVSGFTAEDQVGDRAWIKTDATISGGNSGGMAADDTGHIIGVPTLAASGTGGNITDCRRVQDTNGDGVVNDQDTCIPIGGFINALRPVNLARPLISAAQTGMAYNSPYGGPKPTTQGTGNESFGFVTWRTTGNDCITSGDVQAYPSGVSAITAAFDFSGMTDGQAWGSIWSADGAVIYQTTNSWASGADGNYEYCLYNSQQALPDGNYNVKFYVGDKQNILTQGDVVVGKGTLAPQPTQTADGITLIGTVTDSATGNPLQDVYVYVLTSGVTYDQWASQNYPDSMVLMSTRTDANGNYRMPSTIPRNAPYTIVFSIQGYLDKYGDNLVWFDTDLSEYRMDAQMNQ
jgi:S1-C subfamily serine protease